MLTVDHTETEGDDETEQLLNHCYVEQLKRDIAGALRSTIEAHGPISEDQIGSATKRVAAGIRSSLKRERDLIAASMPKKIRDRDGAVDTPG